MRDIIWTIVVIWLVYKLADMFKLIGAKKAPIQNQQHNNNQTANQKPHSERDIKSAIQKHLNKEGEYVDFEEVK